MTPRRRSAVPSRRPDRPLRPDRPRGRRRDERGYVAIITALLLLVLMGVSAFAVDVGQWYLQGQRMQRAADAAALAGVTKLPGNPTGAAASAQQYSKSNQYENGVNATTVTSTRLTSTQLRVDVSREVKNIFGGLLGIPTTLVSRHAVADYLGPIPMGSPCNEYGNDPEANSGVRSASCSAIAANMWANVNAPNTNKQNGDSVSSTDCATSSGQDGCSGTANTDYDANGYFYNIKVTSSVPSLRIDLFDPVFVDVGLTCDTGFSSGGRNPVYAADARNPWHTSDAGAADRYESMATSSSSWVWCTGDNIYSGSQVMNTRFTVRAPGANIWDPKSGTVVCDRTFGGYTGNLYNVLNQTSSTYNATIAKQFRQWVTDWCTIPNPVVGTYTLQVTSNVGGSPNNADAGNRFAVRAIAQNNLDAATVAGRQLMGMFSNKNGAVTTFHLARVPNGSAGNILRVRLYDVGDSTTSGTIKINPPGGGNYSGCTGSGVTTLINSDCSFTATRAFDGLYQVVNVPIPANYSCNDAVATDCWVTLTYNYGVTAQPTDVTTWYAGLEGDPIRLIE